MARFRADKALERKAARMIVPAVTRITRAGGDGAKRAAPPEKQWKTKSDPLVRPEHAEAHDQAVPENLRFTLRSPEYDQRKYRAGPIQMGRQPRDTDGFTPGNTANCFPGETLVSARDVRAAFRTWYAGPLVTIRTGFGQTLRATPNHPVLTDRGWVAAGKLDVGDHLVSKGGVRTRERASFADDAEPDVQDVPARIDQVFGALYEGGVRERMSSFAVDFHGDRGVGEVDVVRPHGLLHVGVVPPLGQQAGQRDLLHADALEYVALNGGGVEDLCFHRASPPTRGSVSCARKSPSLVGSSLGEAEPLGGRAATSGNAALRQSQGDDAALHAVDGGESVHGCTCLVGGDERIRVERDASARESGIGNALDPRSREPIDNGAPRDAVALSELRRGGSCPPGVSDFLRADVGPVMDQPRCLCGRSEVDPGRLEAVLDRPDVDPDLPRDGGRGSSAVVPLDDVVSVEWARSWSGHVFTLETAAGWFLAEGLATRNCRCFLEEIPDGVSKTITAHPARAAGTRVTGRVTCDHEKAEPAEYGNSVDQGARFMAAGLRAAKRATKRR